MLEHQGRFRPHVALERVVEALLDRLDAAATARYAALAALP
jgi:hypothetical protein